ncbi:hypothetical protein QE152_g22696 [Popillia japonica]|uniref:Uncharacterized protein n=1 Tax=Popillia japonica TaxID=7064 RepID=A0AAW1KI21_POPJA
MDKKDERKRSRQIANELGRSSGIDIKGEDADRRDRKGGRLRTALIKTFASDKARPEQKSTAYRVGGGCPLGNKRENARRETSECNQDRSIACPSRFNAR